jgi:hypothetical protein
MSEDRARRRTQRSALRDLTILAVVWAGVTGPFLTKAYHIDDTVHVLQAEHIAADPTHPLEMEIFWFEWPEWLADSNPITPPVWPYELAAAVALSGEAREPVLNGLAALHLLLLGVAVYGLAARVLRYPLLAAVFAITGPAAVAGRNVMLDVPMMSYLAAGMAALVRGVESDRLGVAAMGALAVGIATVTKLPGAVGIPVLAAYLLLAGRVRWLPLGGVALLPLGLWYAYQLQVTGGVDILRPRGGGGFEPDWTLATSVAVGLGHLPFWGGAVFTGPSFLAALSVERWRLAAALAATATVLAAVVAMLGEERGPLWLLLAFTGGGTALLAGAATGTWRLWRAGAAQRPLAGMLGLWALGHVAFAVAGAWEMNVRFAFLSAVPASLLCLVALEDLLAAAVAPRRAAAAALLVLSAGAAASLAVARADAQWADGYRREAGAIAAAYPGRRLWFVGHWGLQHYATASGMTAYSARDHRLAPGDLLVVPLLAARQAIPEDVEARLEVIERRAIEPSLPIRTMGAGGGFYSTGWGPLPWGWSREPADVVVVARYE